MHRFRNVSSRELCPADQPAGRCRVIEGPDEARECTRIRGLRYFCDSSIQDSNMTSTQIAAALVPMVVEQTARGERAFDIFSRTLY